eukprot:2148869-Prymnesium_polylepis.2
MQSASRPSRQARLSSQTGWLSLRGCTARACRGGQRRARRRAAATCWRSGRDCFASRRRGRTASPSPPAAAGTPAAAAGALPHSRPRADAAHPGIAALSPRPAPAASTRSACPARPTPCLTWDGAVTPRPQSQQASLPWVAPRAAVRTQPFARGAVAPTASWPLVALTIRQRCERWLVAAVARASAAAAASCAAVAS